MYLAAAPLMSDWKAGTTSAAGAALPARSLCALPHRRTAAAAGSNGLGAMAANSAGVRNFVLSTMRVRRIRQDVDDQVNAHGR